MKQGWRAKADHSSFWKLENTRVKNERERKETFRNNVHWHENVIKLRDKLEEIEKQNKQKKIKRKVRNLSSEKSKTGNNHMEKGNPIKQSKIRKAVKLLCCSQFCGGVLVRYWKCALYSNKVIHRISARYGAASWPLDVRDRTILLFLGFPGVLWYKLPNQPLLFYVSVCWSTTLVHLIYQLLTHIFIVSLNFFMPVIPSASVHLSQRPALHWSSLMPCVYLNFNQFDLFFKLSESFILFCSFTL